MNPGGFGFPKREFGVARALTPEQALRARANIGANFSIARTITSASTSSERTLTAADCGKLIILSGTTDFTLTIDPAASLFNGWVVNIKVAGRCVVTLDPNGAETVNGAATVPVAFRQECALVCTGSGFETYGLRSRVHLDTVLLTGTSVGDFILPRGYEFFTVNAAISANTSGDSIAVRFSTDGGGSFVNAAGAYWIGGTLQLNTTTLVSYGQTSDSIQVWGSAGQPTFAQAFRVNISNALTAGATTLVDVYGFGERVASGNPYPQIIGGRRQVAAADNAVRFFATGGGNITARLVLEGQTL